MTNKRCCQSCHYCDVDLTRHEHDHAPIPKAVGGVDTVPICVPCHNLKDRMLFDSWPVSMAVFGVKDVVAVGVPLDDFADWPREWDDLSREGRLVWAKLAMRAAA